MIIQKQLPTVPTVSEPLDLTSLANTATIQPEDLTLALWLLSVPEPPSAITLPRSLQVRRRLARSGLVFVADRRGIELQMEQTPVSVPEAIGTDGTKELFALEHYDIAVSDRIRVVPELESRLRRPPVADPIGRRHYWIDGLGVAKGHPERDFFDRHADQCFFELVDNVHRWARSDRALGVVAATTGGGTLSHNRLHIVVADNGKGILASARDKAVAMKKRGQEVRCISADRAKPEAEVAAAVMTDLVNAVYRDRQVCGAKSGHGLNTVNKHTLRWNGTIDIVSSFPDGGAMHLGRRGRDGTWGRNEYTVQGISGTLVHLTLDAIRDDAISPSEARNPELVAV